MERSPKRQRLLEPLDFATRAYPPYASHERHDEFVEDIGQLELDDDEELYAGADGYSMEGEDGEGSELDEEQAQHDFESSRAALDNKLKTQFEAIFEKYGRDFTGIGDEIDLRTGEIVVDNGHLGSLHAGREVDSERTVLRALIAEPKNQSEEEEEEFEETEATDFDQEDQEEQDATANSEDLDDDEDMLLYQRDPEPAIYPEPEVETIATTYPDPEEFSAPASSHRRAPASFFNTSTSAAKEPVQQALGQIQDKFLADDELISQFGEKLGPLIVKYMSQERDLNEDSIEPAWRAPGPAVATPGRRPLLKSLLLEPENDNTPLNEALSMWGPEVQRLPGRPRKDGTDVMALMKGEAIVNRKYYSRKKIVTTTRTEISIESESGRIIKMPLNDSVDAPKVPDRRKGGTKIKFSQEDDDILLDWVRHIRRSDIPLFSQGGHWKDLEALNPRHTALSYLNRYRQFYYRAGKHHLTAPDGDSTDDMPIPTKRKHNSTASPETSGRDENTQAQAAQTRGSKLKRHWKGTPVSDTQEDSILPKSTGSHINSSEMTLTSRPSRINISSNGTSLRGQDVDLSRDDQTLGTTERRGLEFNEHTHEISKDPTRHPTDQNGSKVALPTPPDIPVSDEPAPKTAKSSLPPLTAPKAGANKNSKIDGKTGRNIIPDSYGFSDDEDNIPSRKPAATPVTAIVSNQHDGTDDPGQGSANESSSLSQDMQNESRSSLQLILPQKQAEYTALMSPELPAVEVPTKPLPLTKADTIPRLEILDSEDFDDLRLTQSSIQQSTPLPPVQAKGKITVPQTEPQLSRYHNPSRNPADSGNTTPANKRRAASYIEGGPSSPSPAPNRTPGGSVRRCGEVGFRCQREFCFKCH